MYIYIYRERNRVSKNVYVRYIEIWDIYRIDSGEFLEVVESKFQIAVFAYIYVYNIILLCPVEVTFLN